SFERWTLASGSVEPTARRDVGLRLAEPYGSERRWAFFFCRRVKGAWWPSRSSKPLSVRQLPDRGRFDSYPLRPPFICCLTSGKEVITCRASNFASSRRSHPAPGEHRR